MSKVNPKLKREVKQHKIRIRDLNHIVDQLALKHVPGFRLGIDQVGWCECNRVPLGFCIIVKHDPMMICRFCGKGKNGK